ncbi:hypothetical protein ACFL3G_08820 [Planctomycetota bacterium]
MFFATLTLGSFGCSSNIAGTTPKVPAIVGTWELTTITRRGTRVRKLMVNEDLTATYQGRNDKLIPVTNLKVEDDQVSFSMLRKYREREFTIELKAAIDGDTLKGQWITPRWTGEVIGQKISDTP